MSSRILLIPPLLLSLAVTTLHSQTKPLTNDDVIQMVKGGLDDETIIKAIQANDSAYDTGVQSLLGLKSAGVNKVLIDTLLEAQKIENQSHAATGGLSAADPPAHSGPTSKAS